MSLFAQQKIERARNAGTIVIDLQQAPPLVKVEIRFSVKKALASPLDIWSPCTHCTEIYVAFLCDLLCPISVSFSLCVVCSHGLISSAAEGDRNAVGTAAGNRGGK